jgi:hypothetical protein
VPLTQENKAVGYVKLDLNLKVSQISFFGGAANDKESWINAEFFRGPPKNVIEEIQSQYPDMKMSEPYFSFNHTPAKWGWKIKLTNQHEIIAFISPAGWKKQTKPQNDYEG